MFEWITAAEFNALIQVILVDIVFAGDNAVVVGLAAAGLPPEQRRTAIFWGIAAAAVLRILFALVTVQLLAILGLLLIGGILLLWVAWKLWRELREPAPELVEGEVPEAPRKTMRQALTQIIIADVSMSLDNVLAVAGVARDHTWVLVVGLALSVAFMGLAASFIARLLQRHRWIGFVGLLLILYIACVMIYDGGWQVYEATTSQNPA
ncbi:MAG: TerC family protein [Gammaproteobacteria bacterium]|nr:TerC family protein [Gammaproteobacteria bacterium]